MSTENVHLGYMISLGAACCGGAAGATVVPWLWTGMPVPDLDDFIVANLIGMVVGTMPGWSAGLVIRNVLNRFLHLGAGHIRRSMTPSDAAL